MFELFCLELKNTKKVWIKRGEFNSINEANVFIDNAEFCWEIAYLKSDNGGIYPSKWKFQQEKFENDYVIENFFEDTPEFFEK